MIFAALVPARGGSTRIPGKNLEAIGHAPLVGLAVRHALHAGIESVTCSSDDDEILDAARRWGATALLKRPADISGEHARVEAAVEHWWLGLTPKPDALVVVNPTAPLCPASRIKEAMAMMERGGYACVYAATAMPPAEFQGDFVQHANGDWTMVLERDWTQRPRTQDCHARAAESGAFYVVRSEHWERHHGLVAQSRRCAVVLLDAHEAVDIDTPADLEFARRIGGGA